MINAEIAAAFGRIADLMEIDGGDGFRINSYRRVGRFLKSYTQDIAAAAAEGSLTKLPGIGKGTAGKINQFIETGHIELLEELQSKLPPGLPDLLRIQGLGPKKIAAVHAQLAVTGLDDLKKVITSGELAKLAGFGALSVKKISEGVAFMEHSGDRTPLGVALPIAEELADALRGQQGVKLVTIAGSLRRGAETIGDVDLLCACQDGKRIIDAFVSGPHVRRVLAAGGTKGSVTLPLADNRELQVDLRVVADESFGAALQYFTGSKEHNVRLREIAAKKKWKLNEYGLFDGDTPIAGESEESVYKKLSLPFAPPELREDAGEFDLSEVPSLVTEDDIKGDLHMHTVASDGKSTIEEMAAAAKARGYGYIAITDHSKSSTIAGGLSVERMRKHIEDVRAVDARVNGLTIFAGCECDILPDGSLDYPDEILADCDVVVASIHSAMGGGQVPPTRRLLLAMENRYVTLLGHPSGRLLLRRPAMDIDMAEIIRAAAANDTALEINASWQRLDLKSTHVRQAVDAGAMLVINTDSHHTDGLSGMRFGVTTARRGWATAKSILNTRSVGGLRTWLAKKRR